MIRYAITNGARFGSNVNALLHGLGADARRWAEQGVEFIQLREKALPAGALWALADRMLLALRDQGATTKLLVNGRADIAAAAGAHGVHLTGHDGELAPADVRAVFARAGLPPPVVSVSCHAVADVERAREAGADLLLFGPVFEKRIGVEKVLHGVGLTRLREACAAAGSVPILALGGVDAGNAAACLAEGARGIAAIRLFSGE